MAYKYEHVKLIRLVDADTVELEIDTGFRNFYEDNFRLNRINAPEKSKPGGREAMLFLAGLLSAGIARVETTKRDKYGRWLAEIYIAVDGGFINVNDAMKIAGHAVPFMDKTIKSQVS